MSISSPESLTKPTACPLLEMENTRVKVGDLILEFDLVEIRKAGYETITPVIVTNVDQFSDRLPLRDLLL
jgi:phosphotransferase system IIA component